MTYPLAGKNFKSKQTLNNYFKYALNNAPTPIKGTWETELKELLCVDYRFRPIVPNIDFISVDQNSKSFYFCTKEGTTVLFDYTNLIETLITTSEYKPVGTDAFIKLNKDGLVAHLNRSYNKPAVEPSVKVN